MFLISQMCTDLYIDSLINHDKSLSLQRIDNFPICIPYCSINTTNMSHLMFSDIDHIYRGKEKGPGACLPQEDIAIEAHPILLLLPSLVYLLREVGPHTHVHSLPQINRK